MRVEEGQLRCHDGLLSVCVIVNMDCAWTWIWTGIKGNHGDHGDHGDHAKS